tara:strand:- start:307 stop:822 length:516 start_codon:yes stop_codon:yes gene_type:complete
MGTDTLNEQLALFPYKKEIVYALETDTRKCRDCKETLPLTNFPIKNIMSNNLGILSKVCSKCSNKNTLESYVRRKKVKLPDKDYCCPICLKNEQQLSNNKIVVDINTYEITDHKHKRKTPWRFDHDHKTGEFRGWLCNSCNISLGMLGDSLESAKRIVKYLEGDVNGSSGV